MEGRKSADIAVGTPLGDMLGFRLNRLSAKIGRLADAEAAEVASISLPEYRILVVLDALQSAGVVTLQDALSIDKAWISRTLGRLNERGLVTSNEDDQDARRSAYQLTAQGRTMAKQLFKRATARNAKFTRGFSEQEQVLLYELLERLESNVASLL